MSIFKKIARILDRFDPISEMTVFWLVLLGIAFSFCK